MTQNEFSQQMEELKNILSMAALKAEEVGSMDLYDVAGGAEANDILELLTRIWNGFMTGDMTNTQHEDQIFK